MWRRGRQGVGGSGEASERGAPGGWWVVAPGQEGEKEEPLVRTGGGAGCALGVEGTTISLTCTLAETRYHTDLPSRQDEEAVGRPHMLPGQVVAGDLQLVPMVYPNFEEDFRAKGAATLEAYNSSSRGGRQSSAYPTLALEEAGLGELAASETGRHLLLVTLLEDPHLPIWQPRSPSNPPFLDHPPSLAKGSHHKKSCFFWYFSKMA